MTDRKANADKAREILGSAGIRHSVGTTSDDSGASLLVVDVPYDVDRASVQEKLGGLDTNVLVRHAKRTIIAQ